MARTIRSTKQLLTQEQIASLTFAKDFFKAFKDDCLLHHNLEITDNSQFPRLDGSGEYERAYRWYSLHKTIEAKATLAQKVFLGKETRTAKALRKLEWFKEHQNVELAHTVIHGPSGELYLKGQMIGQGTFGRVYLAVNESGESFAIKYEKSNDTDLGQPNEEIVLKDRGLLTEPKLCHRIDTTPKSAKITSTEEELFITITPYLGEPLTDYAKTISHLTTKDRIKYLMAPLCQEYADMHTGKAFKSKISRANCDVNPNNIVILDKQLHAIDTATASENIHESSNDPSGNPAFVPPIAALEKISFLQKDIHGVMRCGYIAKSFKGYNHEYTRAELTKKSNAANAHYDYIFNNITQYDDCLTPPIDTTTFPTDWHVIYLLSIIDISSTGQLVRHDSSYREFPKSLMELKTKFMLIYLEINPEILDDIPENTKLFKALYLLAEADVYSNSLWRKLLSLKGQPNCNLVEMTLIIATINIKFLKKGMPAQLYQTPALQNLIIDFSQQNKPFLPYFLTEIMKNNHFLNMLFQLEKIDKKFISHRLGENRDLQKAFMVLMQFDPAIFTKINIKAVLSHASFFMHCPLNKAHQLIANNLDLGERCGLDFDGNLFKAALQCLRQTALYRGGFKNKWYNHLESNSTLQLSIFLLTFFEQKLVTESTVLKLKISDNPIALTFHLINTEIEKHKNSYIQLNSPAQSHPIFKALVFLTLGNCHEHTQAINAMQNELIAGCERGTPCLQPLITLHKSLLNQNALQANGQRDKHQPISHVKSFIRSGSSLTLYQDVKANGQIKPAGNTVTNT